MKKMPLLFTPGPRKKRRLTPSLQTIEKVCHCEPVLTLAWGESRALPVAGEARRTSGSGQNFGGFNAAAKFWAPQQEICFPCLPCVRGGVNAKR